MLGTVDYGRQDSCIPLFQMVAKKSKAASEEKDEEEEDDEFKKADSGEEDTVGTRGLLSGN